MNRLFFSVLCFCCFLMTSCKSAKNVDHTKDYASDQIEIDMRAKFKAKTLERNFESLGVELLCMKDEEKNIGIFKVNVQVKPIEEMVKFFDREVGVEGASRSKGCMDK